MDERNERNCPGVCVPSACVCEPGGGEEKKNQIAADLPPGGVGRSNQVVSLSKKEKKEPEKWRDEKVESENKTPKNPVWPGEKLWIEMLSA